MVTYDKEGSAGREVMPGKRQQVGKFVSRLEDEPVLGEHPPDKTDHSLYVFRAGRLNSQVGIVHSRANLFGVGTPATHLQLTLGNGDMPGLRLDALEPGANVRVAAE